jgi:dimethylhistidine N-methyltransferase
MARHLGPDCLLVEYGSGSSEKTRVLLDSLVPCAYVPVDISRDHLLASCNALAAEYPQVEVLPVCADFTAPFALPVPERAPTRTVAYFPGSTIGNFEREDAVALLHSIRTTCGRSGALLVGADLVKDRETLECAYDDSRGVTAAFNRNLLVRLNAELGADFAPDRFAHEARWLAGPGRIEMHLVSRRDQTVRLGGRTIAFRAGESICTEHSHKYTLDGFAAMADEAGFGVERVFCDEQRLFSVQLLGVR